MTSRFILGATFVLILPGFLKAAPETRLASPSGKYIVGFEAVDRQAARLTKAVAGQHRDYREQYWIRFYLASSTGTMVTTMVYDDADPAGTPADLLKTFIWSPQEEFVDIPVLRNAVSDNHAFQVVIAMDPQEHTALKFEGDHIRWFTRSHAIGDLNTKDVPGGLIELAAADKKVHIALYPLHGIGFKLLTLQGSVALVQEFPNDYPAPDKTSWDKFTPACLTLNLETLKKNSAPCPAP